ncbi:MAG TPA: CocE/NonD family hydrolase, partial [Myxococcota bacterium]|nr:CocE/NonD family hydrolase [Myxococcota bacterium]
MFRCLLLIAAFLVAACERPAPVSSGTWVGGFELSGEQVATEPGIWLDFDGGRARVGEADAWTSVLHLERRGDVLHFEVVFNGAVHVFDARRGSSDVIEGVVACGDTVGVFRFDRLAPYDATEFAQQVQGTYVTASRSLLVTSEPSMGRLFDIDSGATHALHPLADGTYLVGPGFATAFPRAGLLRAKRDAGGRVISLTLDTDGKHETGHLRDPAMQHVRFSSQGAELAGTVLLAEGAASRPGVVFVHGSGRITRDDWWQQAMARVFLRDGFDVLLYDKRGVGESGGEYVGRGAKNQNNVSPENLELLAMDAKAAVATLAARPGVDPKRVGLFGISQAGWIIPLAASASDRVAFVAEVSGPAVSTFLEDVYSKLLAEDGGRPSHLT